LKHQLARIETDARKEWAMKVKWAVTMLAGSIVVHAIIVACNPVHNAVADPSASVASADTVVQVADEPCDKTYTQQGQPVIGAPTIPATTTVQFAEHAYSGKSKEEIAGHVTHWTEITDANKEGRPPSYAGGLNLQSAVYTRDGYAGAGCSPGTVTHFIWHP
jgi:hypothetical protein